MIGALARDDSARRDAAIAALLACAKIGASIALVSAFGFRQISDDDYARTVIAESFAHAPKLDPSGTSWLPFPFWLTGTAMAAFGRSLGVARAVGYAASGLGAAIFFVALRRAGAARGLAAAATLVASLTAWSLWLGAAPVPEGFTGPLMAAAMLGLVHDDGDARGARVMPALLAAVCALSRYEAWPLAATVSVCALLAARRVWPAANARRALAIAALAAAGPLAWMAWNRIDHGSALHFVARVTRYRHAIGAAGAPLGDKLVLYPAAFVRGFPEAVVAGLLGAAAVVRAPRRFVSAAIAAALVFGFLVAGELGEGAPTHHPERALVWAAWLAIGFGAIVAGAARERAAPYRWAVFGACFGAAALIVLRAGTALHDYPGRGDADRAAQIARGEALRAAGARDLVVTPCAYEHFALMAAYGAPEAFRIVPKAPGATTPVTPECPTIAP